MGGAFRLWESISIGACISVMIMFMKGEYIIRYGYTFHMLKIASNQCYERCFRLWDVHIHMGVHFSYGRCISVMIMFMRREYIIGYSYTFYMLKTASSYQ
jgi:hypothetical protein